MKIFELTLVVLLICFVSAAPARKHEFLNLGSMNPFDMARLMSGDFTAILPSAIQPFARKLLGKEE